MPTPTAAPAPDIEETIGQIIKLPFSWEMLLSTVLIVAICLVAIKVITTIFNRAIQRLNVEKTLHAFLRSGLQVILWFVAVVIVLGNLGVDFTSLIALFSVVGLAVSLAIQGTLSNLAGGMMLLTSKPFKAGDYIQAAGTEGIVTEVGLVYTRLKTYDNKLILIPNGEISKEKIINYTGQQTRRVDVTYAVSYDEKPEKIKGILTAAYERHPKALADPAPFVGLTKVNDSNVEYTLRVWCDTEDYWEVYYDLLQQLWDDFAAAGVDLTYNHLNVHLLDQ